jgi:hypothetical protein
LTGCRRVTDADGEDGRDRPIAQLGDVLDEQPGADEGVEQLGQWMKSNCNPNCDPWPYGQPKPPPQGIRGGGRGLRRLGDLNPGRARTLTALAVPFRV